VLVAEAGYRRDVHARVDALVDLPSPETKGIHMSRLYRLVDTLSEGEAMTPAGLKQLLADMIESHRDCSSRNARLSIAFDLLVSRPALVTEGLAGWKSYPAKIDVSMIDGEFRCNAQVTVEYSSTCPCSAALARQIVEQSFMNTFGNQAMLSPTDVATWLRANASIATPHSQRSEAHVTVAVSSDAASFGLLPLIDRIEAAVGTPVQTAVKRADEQAFAALNGQNLMFVEDAARRIEAALEDQAGLKVYVRHVESLHPHDAVAWAEPGAAPGADVASRAGHWG
jgi:GTP cyclohydrolase I